MALFTRKIMSTDRYELDSSTVEVSLNLYDNTHSVIIYNEGSDSIRILFGSQNFGTQNFKTISSGGYYAVEVGISEINPSQRILKVRLDDTTSSTYVRIHQLVASKR